MIALGFAFEAACEELCIRDGGLDVAKRERVSKFILTLVLKGEHDIDALHRRAVIHFRNTSSPPVTAMQPNKTAIERAFELARTGLYSDVSDIKDRLRNEGYFTRHRHRTNASHATQGLMEVAQKSRWSSRTSIAGTVAVAKATRAKSRRGVAQQRTGRVRRWFRDGHEPQCAQACDPK